VGRVLENEDEVVQMIKKKGKMVDFQIVNMGEMNFEDQLILMRRTNILGSEIYNYEIDLLRYI